MSRSNKSRIAVTLLSALAFGANDASAMNSGIKNSGNLATKSSSFSASKDSKSSPKSPQTVGTVGGATSNKNLKRIEQGLSMLEKVLIATGIVAGTGLMANETVGGVMWAMGKESDSILKGKYSFMNFLRSKIKKDDEQPAPGGKNPRKFGPDEKKEIVDQDEIKKHNIQKIDEALDACALEEKNFDKNAMKQKILQAFEKFVKIDLSKFSDEKFGGIVAYENVEISEGLSKLKEICNNQLKIFSAEFHDGQLFICYENEVGYNLNFNENNTKVYCYGRDDDGDIVIGSEGLDICDEVIV